MEDSKLDIQNNHHCDDLASHRRSSLGSTSALNVAFNDLKRRYLTQQSELVEFNSRKTQMSSELAQSKSTIKMLERKVEQLQKSLQSKIIAYNNLEEVYKQTRGHEESLIKHSEETQHLLEDSLHKLHRCQIENEGIHEEYHQLSKKLKSTVQEKTLVEKELQTLLQVPEIKISSSEQKLVYPEMQFIKDPSDLSGLCLVQSLQRQVHSLNSENQTLRTNVHWLSKELKIARLDKSTKRIRSYSDSLEEGKQTSDQHYLKDNSDEGFKSCNMYIQKLHKTIRTLKETLMRNNKIINFLFSKKVGVVDHGEEYCNSEFKKCDTKSSTDKSSGQPDCNIKCDKNFSDMLENRDTDCINVNENYNKRKEHKTHKSSKQNVYFKSTLEGFCISESSSQHANIKLPPSLIENVQLLQTQTYLMSKTLPQHSHSSTDKHGCKQTSS